MIPDLDLYRGTSTKTIEAFQMGRLKDLSLPTAVLPQNPDLPERRDLRRGVRRPADSRGRSSEEKNL